ncbi:hypothetical protein D9615_010519 [Tricholomella constricta]|uniref:Uncharacterized protein n=1 Tax=Tricholomella constricta TaxID=117010 RepID=A0A8H5LSR5_9AGAR|nr:hypothetical protein D9615_010519 [Tricholomella constricta]
MPFPVSFPSPSPPGALPRPVPDLSRSPKDSLHFKGLARVPGFGSGNGNGPRIDTATYRAEPLWGNQAALPPVIIKPNNEFASPNHDLRSKIHSLPAQKMSTMGSGVSGGLVCSGPDGDPGVMAERRPGSQLPLGDAHR